MFETIAGLIFDVLLYGTAKLILPIISFGKWRADSIKSKAGLLSGYPFVRKDKDGIAYFSYEGGILFGGGIWIIAIIFFASVTG